MIYARRIRHQTVFEQRERPAVRAGSCRARAVYVRLQPSQRGHQLVSAPKQAVAVAVDVTFAVNFPYQVYFNQVIQKSQEGYNQIFQDAHR